MKFISDPAIEKLSPGRLGPREKFAFECHSGLDCFNRCCHHLNLFLYPYDVLRLCRGLGVSADQFIEKYVDVVLRDGHYFPEVVLRMADGPGHPCIFLTPRGCSVYADRPHTCRFFPVERGVFFNAAAGRNAPVYFFRPPEFCLGQAQSRQWTIESYIRHQQAGIHDRMTAAWADVRQLFEQDPWGVEGPQGAKARMAFMAAYNMDRFREFVFNTSFLRRYRVSPMLVLKMRRNDLDLLSFGFDWIRLFVWGQPVSRIQPR